MKNRKRNVNFSAINIQSRGFKKFINLFSISVAKIYEVDEKRRDFNALTAIRKEHD